MAETNNQYVDRQDPLPISWEHFHGLCKGLARAVAPYAPECILAVSRGGNYAGTLLAHLLRVELYPVRLTRRVADEIRFRSPRWRLGPPAAVRDRRVLVVDEISGSGETLRKVKAKSEARGAREVRLAVLYAHARGAAVPDYIGLISDALILNPWDREVFQNGRFVFHPEYTNALALQGLAPEPELLIPADEITSAKARP